MQLDKIWDQYRDALRGFLRKRVDDEDDVEDLLQEVLIKTHANIAGLRDAGALRGWLFQVARNAVMDFYRRKGRAQDVAVEDPWYGDGPDESVHRDLEGCVQPFLNALPAADADLLRAVDLGGQSQKSYAAEHDLSYSTLKSRVQAARAKLAAQYQSCCRFELNARGELVQFQRRDGPCDGC